MTQKLIYPTIAELFRMFHTEGRKFLAAGSIQIESLTYNEDWDQYTLTTRLGTFTSGPTGTYGVFEVTVPPIHSNGTSPEDHFRVFFDQRKRLQEAIELMENNQPHMRDFYILHNAEEVYSAAVSQNLNRIKTLRAIQEELTIIIEAMCAVKARKGSK